MKTINLTNLKISNFKGVKYFDGNFTDKTIISGANATGKTTLFDAFTWLLFGKNSEDKKDFGIKPLTADNKPIHRVDMEVQATLFLSENNIPVGEESTLRRVMREKWVTRRGSAEEEFSGHETLYFWNDVPLSQAEYEMKVSSILGDTVQLFKLITNPFYFNQMKWQDRRAILVNMAGEIPTPERFKDLLSAIGNKTLDEYRKELSAKKKKLKAELETIPARIDEVKRSKPAAQDWKAIEDEISTTEKKLQETIDELTNSGKSYDLHNTQVVEYKKKINNLKNKISDFEFEGSRNFNSQVHEKSSNLQRIEADFKRQNETLKYDQDAIVENNKRIERNTKKMDQLRKEFFDVTADVFKFDQSKSNCPTCGQALPQDQIETMSDKLFEQWRNDKNERLDDLRKQGVNLKTDNENLVRENLARNERYDAAIRDLQKQKEYWESVEITSVAKYLEGNKEYHKAKKELADLEASPVEEVPADRNLIDLKLRQSGYNDRISTLKQTLALRDQIRNSDDREAELLRQEKEFSQQLADLEKIEFQISEYVKNQVEAVEQKVNSIFSGVQFKMFSDQINGGMVETCETLVNGVPWTDANNAAKINSGLMIINTLTRHFGVSAPIWVDNSESVNNVYQPAESQLILLYVTEDKVLTIK